MKTKTSKLFENYKKACNDYLHAFCSKHDFQYEEDCWVADQPGTIALIGDYFVGMDSIITDIEEDTPEDEFIKWYDWTLMDGNNMNYSTWLKRNEPKEGVDLSEKINEFKKYLEESIKEGSNDDCPF